MNYGIMDRQCVTGSIVLYNSQGVRVAYYRYSKPTGRKGILKYWEDLYGAKFRDYHYHILPDISDSDLSKIRLPQENQQKAA